MIYNPVIVSGGGQVYKITDNSGLGFPTSAEAGAYVVSAEDSFIGGIKSGIFDSDGYAIPYGSAPTWTGRAGSGGPLLFVMPQSDVIIT